MRRGGRLGGGPGRRLPWCPKKSLPQSSSPEGRRRPEGPENRNPPRSSADAQAQNLPPSTVPGRGLGSPRVSSFTAARLGRASSRSLSRANARADQLEKERDQLQQGNPRGCPSPSTPRQDELSKRIAQGSRGDLSEAQSGPRGRPQSRTAGLRETAFRMGTCGSTS